MCNSAVCPQLVKWHHAQHVFDIETSATGTGGCVTSGDTGGCVTSEVNFLVCPYLVTCNISKARQQLRGRRRGLAHRQLAARMGPPESPSGACTLTRDFHILHIRCSVRIADRQTLGHAVSNRDRHGGGGGQESFVENRLPRKSYLLILNFS